MTKQSLRLRKTKDPCPRCKLHRQLCLCSELFSLHLDTRVTLLIHHREIKRTTNTGLLALEVLANSKMVVRGVQGGPADFSEVLDDQYRSCLLYPGEESLDLQDFLKSEDQRPIHLLVPDGNWRQASKVAIRHPEFREVPRVKLAQPDQVSRESLLRQETKKDGMATLAAIATALGCIEGAQVGAKLMDLYHLKVERTLTGRGQILRRGGE